MWDCYLDALWADASARGTILLAVTHDATSDAADALSVEPIAAGTIDAGSRDGGPPLGDPATAACVARAFRERPFKVPAGVKLVIEVSLHPLVVSRDQ